MAVRGQVGGVVSDAGKRDGGGGGKISQLSVESLWPLYIYKQRSIVHPFTSLYSPDAEHRRNELIAEADNVAADSEDSEEEWNYYKPEEQEGKNQQQLHSNGVGKDPSLVEKLDQCEEKEPCSPKPHEENLSLSADNQHQLLRPGSGASIEPETDDVTAEFDELHEKSGVTFATTQHQFEPRELQFELDNTEIEAETTLPADELPLDKDFKEESQKPDLVLKQELLHEDIDRDSSNEDDEDMDSHLNPDAAEFVPTSPPPPVNAQLISPMSSDLIAGSPLKQSQRALKNNKIPSEEEFKNEICRRPSEIDNNGLPIPEYSNGEASPAKDLSSILVGGGFDDTKQKTQIHLLDESEISSTKAEFGDTAEFSVTSELFKTGTSNIDCSFASDRCDFDFSSNNAMTTSMTPADFKNAFEQQPDLNKVHELNDEDLMCDDLNGSIGEKDDDGREIVRDLELSQENIQLDLDNFAPKQQQSAELFTSIAEQKESSNSDLFSSDEKQSPEKEVSHSNSNPFSSDFEPLESKSSEQQIQDLAEDLHKVNIQQDQQPIDVVMLNPLDLNIGSTSVEQRAVEPVLVSPIKEPEVMTSKFAEEENLVPDEKLDEFAAAAASAPSPASNPMDLLEIENKVNLSESLQEFTQLEEKLSPIHFEVQDNEAVDQQQQPLLKENLVDEQKDVEELAPTPEAKIGEASLVSNEVVAPIAVAAAVATAAVAATAAAAKSPKSAASVTKTSKPAAKLSSKTPTSPTKTATAPKAATTAAAKKPATASTAASRPKAVSSTPAKPAVSKTATTASKTAATAKPLGTAPKATPRAAPAASKTKPLSSVASKISSTTEKTASSNGDVKPATRTSLAPKPMAARPATTKATALSKPTTAARTSGGAGATTTAAKPRPTSATTATKTASSKLSSASVTSSTNGSARPKTAPATGLAAAKPRVPLTKSPMTDKQTKETANKQISSARATSAAVSKTRQTTVSSTSTATKRMSLAPKPAPVATTSPAKKPAPISRPGAAAKTTSGVAGKVNSKVSSTTKSSGTAGSTTATPVPKPVQNGTCEPASEKITTNTTANTTNNEEDIPKKDVSPIEQPADNQLIAVE
ncbi:hypothetical protein QAD02_015891 [Eretmocerus hayati]|uniref:Uncharacterized protein n=1 Tax=Eretmocerus hayati TaxID=131215 RepID=A0ACC2PBY5_9HYME|nr:hypothetical protein QAD02_015891 [Eretmocerus hayati]